MNRRAFLGTVSCGLGGLALSGTEAGKQDGLPRVDLHVHLAGHVPSEQFDAFTTLHNVYAVKVAQHYLDSGFTSIPSGIYWAITTLTTVGFGDITPATGFGKFIASFVMIMGYGVIAVPTGIVTFEIASTVKAMKENRECNGCGHHNHEADANYCKSCGEKLG